MKTNIALFIISIFVFIPILAHADIQPVERYIQQPSIKGKSRLSYMIWEVYDATLLTPNGRNYDPNGPLALKLDYLIDLKGSKIAERSADEIRKQGFKDEEKLIQWEKAMKNIFPDVLKGNNITGIRDNQGKTIFYKDGVKIGEIADQEFSKYFFDIWLSQKTSQPQLRQQLLGLN